jgi:hypothetical protein
MWRCCTLAEPLEGGCSVSLWRRQLVSNDSHVAPHLASLLTPDADCLAILIHLLNFRDLRQK